jgi:hypothetical protein
MNTPPATTSEPDWLLLLIIVGGFGIIFPLFWCFIVWILSRASGWHRLALRYPGANRPMTGARHAGVTGMVGVVSYRHVLTLHFESDGFFLEVMPLFRIGQPRVFIPWSEIAERKPFAMRWWNAIRLTVGHPEVATIRLPADLVEKYAPPER